MNLLLIFGGQSSEHDVSIMSATNVLAAIDRQKYTVLLCYITREGQWRLVDSIEQIGEGKNISIVPGGQQLLIEGEQVGVDVVFPVLHGANGEDGTIQGLAELWHVPCVGPSLTGAAVTMDKLLTKRLLRDAGIPVVDWLEWPTAGEKPSYRHASQGLGSVLFVKPVSAGSSVGVSRASDEDSFSQALDEAAKHSAVVMIEPAIEAREIELAVLGNESPRVSGAGEIKPGEEFYSYDDKYADDATSEVRIPADIDDDTEKTLQAYALEAYRLTAGRGMARVDFFIDRRDNQIYLNEINSIPGFTNISMYPKLWIQQGLSYSQLVDRLISLALDNQA